jgi:hypothetical protein
MGIFALSTLLVAGAGIYLFSKVFPNFQPGNNKVQADFMALKAELAEQEVELTPVNYKELELLAIEDARHSRRKGITTNVRGQLVTIFHEPLVLYAYKRYLSTGGEDAVLYAKTSAHEFFYWIKPKSAKIVVNDIFLGKLNNDGILHGGKKDRMIAKIQRQEEEYAPIIIEGREAASLSQVESRRGANLSNRAFGYVREQLSAEETVIVLAIAIHELVHRNLQ